MKRVSVEPTMKETIVRYSLSLLIAVLICCVGLFVPPALRASASQSGKGKRFVLHGAQASGFLAVDGKGNVYSDSVKDLGNFASYGSSDSLIKFSPKGKILARWDGLNANGDRADQAGGIALDGNGDVYAVDTTANCIVKLSSSLTLLGQFGGYGTDPGQFIEPEGLAIDAEGDLYVADMGNARVQKLSPDGSVLAVWNNPGDFRNPVGITVDRSGLVYVVDAGYSGYNQLVKLSASGQHLGAWTFGNPSTTYGVGVASDKRGDVYVADDGDAQILKFSPAGKLLSGSFSAPIGDTFLGIAVTPKGIIYTSQCASGSSDPSICWVAKRSPMGKATAAWYTDVKVTAPGTKVDIGGYGLYVHCTGQGSPTVLLEAGYGDNSLVWNYVQPQIATQTRVCAYDRAGLGNSDARPAKVKVTGLIVTQELHTLLQNAHIPGPYVMVGHSWGGGFIQLYAYTYPSEVAGMVEVDSINGFQFGAGYGTGDQVGLAAPSLRADTPNGLKGTLGDLPLVTLTENADLSSCNNCFAPASTWDPLQNQLASASSNSVHVKAMRSGHYIELAQPGIVVEGVRDVVAAVRASSHLLQPCGTAFQQLGGQCMP